MQELSEQRSTITNKGVVDFTTKQLAAMQDSGLELPQINQLEASRCRSVPRELRAMAKANGMKLLSHQDNGGECLFACNQSSSPRYSISMQHLYRKPTLSAS
eukprot:TRINITY_DN8315_c0_g1_i2.p2 TRINITY_DN8315_c0_g1~~TRINITY_DN8315_c0_g1_i2.p2  ORF type:complete len:102 (+),score=15.65 TRINITY_DN8315_c0_g1_i2:1010-1315(+)